MNRIAIIDPHELSRQPKQQKLGLQSTRDLGLQSQLSSVLLMKQIL